MNEDVLIGKWKEIIGGTKEMWGKLTRDDQIRLRGVKEKLIGALQTRCGYVQGEADQERKDFISRIKNYNDRPAGGDKLRVFRWSRPATTIEPPIP